MSLSLQLQLQPEQAHLIFVLQLVLKRPLAQWFGHEAGPRLDDCLAVNRAAYRCPDGKLYQEAVDMPDKPGKQFTIRYGYNLDPATKTDSLSRHIIRLWFSSRTAEANTNNNGLTA